jgi:DNA-directed RNA polymerase specialized sigma24 family protein
LEDINNLYKRYYYPTKNVLRKWGCNSHIFEDIYHEAFIIFVEKQKNAGDEKWSQQGYITRICKNKWFKERERLKIYEPLEDYEEFEDFEESGEPGESIKKQMFYYNEDNKEDHLIELLLKHLKNMSAVCQEVLNLYSLGHSEQKISNILNLDDSKAVKNKKYYCKVKLRSMVMNDPLFDEMYE